MRQVDLHAESCSVASKRLTDSHVRHILLCLGIVITAGLSIHFHALHMPLYDYSYLSTVPYRVSLGQIPYRDFMLPMLPGTFYVLAGAYMLLGWGSHTLLITTVATAVTAYILLLDVIRLIDSRLALGRRSAGTVMWFAATLAGVGYIIALPFYDNLAVLAVLLSLDIVLRAQRRPDSVPLWVAAGASLMLPTFFKQNIGGFYLLGIGLATTAAYVANPSTLRERKRCLCAAAAGCLGTIMLFAVPLAVLGALGEFLNQTVRGASNGKSVLSLSQLHPYLTTTSLLITITACIACFARSRRATAFFISWPWLLLGFLSTLSVVNIVNIEPTGYTPSFALPLDQLPALVVSAITASLVLTFRRRRWGEPLMSLMLGLAMTVAGAMLSQGAWGSSYALGPMVVLLAATYLSYSMNAMAKASNAMIATGLILFSIWLLAYAASGDRLRFVDVFSTRQGFGDLGSSLTFTSMPASTRQAMEGLIPILDSSLDRTILEVPMEDPLPFFASSFTPWWKCAQANATTCPDERLVLTEFLSSPPDILILKIKPQLTAYKSVEPTLVAVGDAVRSCYVPNHYVEDQYQVFVDLIPNRCLRNKLLPKG